MTEKFREVIGVLSAKCQTLLSMEPVIAGDVPNGTPLGGVYLFSEGGIHLYAGRTKRRIAVRIRSHFSVAPDCPLAWQLAREATGSRATYTPAGSRKALLGDPAFKTHYEDAKNRIRRMHVRYVHEPDPLRQALLEIYVIVAVETRYNDFDTH